MTATGNMDGGAAGTPGKIPPLIYSLDTLQVPAEAPIAEGVFSRLHLDCRVVEFLFFDLDVQEMEG